MTLSNAEQYMMELVNRARLDPIGEAARHGIDLNAGLTTGYLGTQVRFVLAPNTDLEDAAIRHSTWMLNTDIFSHTGVNGTTPMQRVTAEGYVAWVAGENISWRGSTGSINLEAMIAQQHSDLFLSAGHRVNILYDNYREIGLGQEAGIFTYSGTNYNASMVTQNFGASGSNYFVTGVAYNDTNADGFYSIGEGRSGVTFASGTHSAASAAAGGYGLEITLDPNVLVTGNVGNLSFSVKLAADLGNAKLDLVNGNTFLTSADITLMKGISNARLLGAADLDARGNGSGNRIEGNAAANSLLGLGGADTLLGGDGRDSLYGGSGDDQLFGGLGSDQLRGGLGNDLIEGGIGADTIFGDQGADVLTGGAGADKFVFYRAGGVDTLTDFNTEDTLMIDNAIWGNLPMTSADVVNTFGHLIGGVAILDFNNGQTITLNGITTLNGLANEITIF